MASLHPPLASHVRGLLLLVVASFTALGTAQTPPLDTDGDGLSDSQEIHKYFTDPSNADSDGDGTPDNDPDELREYAYTIRTVLRVLGPMTPEWITGEHDFWQDARVLARNGDLVDLEIVCYPLATPRQRSPRPVSPEPARAPHPRARWLASGATGDHTRELRTRLLAEFLPAGGNLTALQHEVLLVELAENLLRRARYDSAGFTTFATAFDDEGTPFVEASLRPRLKLPEGRTLAEQWRGELSATGMYELRRRGSCTSTAIYLDGCLSAAYMPTRVLYCVPLIDTNVEAQHRMLAEGVRDRGVRRLLQQHLPPTKSRWTSHTINEVFVDGMWRRLDAARLGRVPYAGSARDSDLDMGPFAGNGLGLLLHVATVADWAEAEAHTTIGRHVDAVSAAAKSGTAPPASLLPSINPYIARSIEDRVGKHFEQPESSLEVLELHWGRTGPKVPVDIRQRYARQPRRFDLIARIDTRSRLRAIRLGPKDLGTRILGPTLERLDLAAELVGPNGERLSVNLDPGFCWGKNNGFWVGLRPGTGVVESLASLGSGGWTLRPREDSVLPSPVRQPCAIPPR